MNEFCIKSKLCPVPVCDRYGRFYFTPMAKKTEISASFLDGLIRHLGAVLDNHVPRQRTIRSMEALRQVRQDLAKLKRLRNKIRRNGNKSA